MGATRSTEVFCRALKESKPLAEAFSQVLSQSIKVPSLRFLRATEGGELPPEARGTSPVDAKGGGKGAPAAASEGDPAEDLLPPHTQAAYILVGAPWIFGEDGGAAGGGKKK